LDNSRKHLSFNILEDFNKKEEEDLYVRLELEATEAVWSAEMTFPACPPPMGVAYQGAEQGRGRGSG